MSKKRNIFFIIILASSSLLLNFFFDSAISKYHAVDEDVEVNDCYAYGPEKETGLADDKYALNSTHKPDNNEDTK